MHIIGAFILLLHDAVQDVAQDDQQVKDPLIVPDGPITRSRAKKIKEAMLGLVMKTMAETKGNIKTSPTLKMGLAYEEPPWVTLIQALE